MPTGEIQRPREGDDKDPIVRPCPCCGKYIPNDVIHELERGEYLEDVVWCPTRECQGQLHIYRHGQTYSLDW